MRTCFISGIRLIPALVYAHEGSKTFEGYVNDLKEKNCVYTKRKKKKYKQFLRSFFHKLFDSLLDVYMVWIQTRINIFFS